MLGVALYQSKPSYSILIEDKTPAEGEVNELDFETMANYITGIGLHYDKLSFFAGVKTPGETAQQEIKGKTKSSQFGLAFTGMKLRVEASARFYSGFYDNSSPQYMPDSSTYYQNSDMKTKSYKLKLFYFFNFKNKFSYGASYVNNTRQLKSAGSLLFTSNLYHFAINSDVPIVPPYLEDDFVPYDSVNKFTTTGLSAGIGYTHTFVIFKRIFFNILGSIGIENQAIRLSDYGTQVYKTNRTILSAYDFRTSFGYNSNRFFVSFQTIIDGNLYEFQEIRISNNFLNAVALIGYRFGAKIGVIDKFNSK
jgi:hypothetical protein